MKYGKLLLLMGFLTIYGMSQLLAQEWEQLNNCPFYLDHSYAIGYEGKAYVIEGVSNGGENRMWQYTVATDSWSVIGSFPGAPRGIAIGEVADDKFYFGFGTHAQSGQSLNDLWVFDPADGSFTELPSCPCQGRSHPSLAINNNKIYMGTGSTANGDLDDWWVYDIIAQTWTQKTDMPGGDRHHPFFFSLDDKVYVGGGHVYNWLEWDTVSEEWTLINGQPLARVAGTQFAYGGKGFLLGGDEDQHVNVAPEESFMSYDPAADEWENLAALPNGSRWAPSSFVLDGIVYYFGGYDDDGPDNTMWKFNLNELLCQPAQNPSVMNVGEDNVELSWFASSSSTDVLKWREVGSSWNDVSNPTAVFQLEDLEPCTEYEFLLETSCADGTEVVSTEAIQFLTLGCGACLDLEFCQIPNGLAGGNFFIEEIVINDFVSTTGDDGGYGNFVASNSETIAIGESFEWSMQPGFTGASEPLNLRMWIDFNADGAFDAAEKVVDNQGVESFFSKTIEVPQTASVGISRMRIIYGSGLAAAPCSINGLQLSGEIEDYCIELTAANISGLDDFTKEFVSVYPNPIGDSFQLQSSFPQEGIFTVRIIDITGKVVAEHNGLEMEQTIDAKSLTSGIYFLQVEDAEKNVQSIKVVR